MTTLAAIDPSNNHDLWAVQGTSGVAAQLALLDLPQTSATDARSSRSGVFVDKMSPPIHRWFRYSAGFAAQSVAEVLSKWGVTRQQIAMDPFTGSGTVSVVCDSRAIPSISVEARPMVARIARIKLSWTTPVERFARLAQAVSASGWARGDCAVARKLRYFSDYLALNCQGHRHDDKELHRAEGLKNLTAAVLSNSFGLRTHFGYNGVKDCLTEGRGTAAE